MSNLSALLVLVLAAVLEAGGDAVDAASFNARRAALTMAVREQKLDHDAAHVVIQRLDLRQAAAETTPDDV